MEDSPCGATPQSSGLMFSPSLGSCSKTGLLRQRVLSQGLKRPSPGSRCGHLVRSFLIGDGGEGDGEVIYVF